MEEKKSIVLSLRNDESASLTPNGSSIPPITEVPEEEVLQGKSKKVELNQGKKGPSRLRKGSKRGVKEDSPQEKRRNLCKTVVSDATKDAQTKCNSYLENERDCRILRGNVAQCMAFTLDADGCVGMVVRAAVEKAGPTVTP